MTPAQFAPSVLLVGLVAAASSWSEGVGRADVDARLDAGQVDDAGRADAGGTASWRYEVRNGSVYDTKTKLTWQRDVPTPAAAWIAARDYCGSLDLDGGGWRLPSVSELQTLIDETTSDPAVDLTAFPGTPSDYFWTSSVVPSFESFAWTVYFGYGLSTFFDVNQAHQVRCVR